MITISWQTAWIIRGLPVGRTLTETGRPNNRIGPDCAARA